MEYTDKTMQEFIAQMNKIEMDETGARIVAMIAANSEETLHDLVVWLKESKETDFNTIVRKAVEIKRKE